MEETMHDTPPKEGSILIVDDESSLRETFHFFLSRAGYDPVFTASGFSEAVNILESEPVDVVISDIVLEKSTGLDILKHARKLGVDCPFILITGYPDIDTATESLRYGAFDYIVKPVEKSSLLRSVHLAMQQRNLEIQRHQAEQERERYRIFLDTVFKSAADAIVIVDDGLRVIKLNGAAHTLFETILPDMAEGAQLGSEVNASGFSPLRADLLRVLRTGEEVKEHRFECRGPDGELKILSICASPLQLAGDSMGGAVIVIRDMTTPADAGSSRRTGFHRFIGGSDAMQRIYTLIENVGRVDTTVLITGESGTGKELCAEALHKESPRCKNRMIKVDCTAIPENLLESELFGHRKGSFTGAEKDRKGLLLQADGGTLFLDEIGEISAMTQLRLLRFLQERTFYPVGSDIPISVDTRVITATNVDLGQKVRESRFREDLYFRLKVIDINLPPLRDRNGDKVMLAKYFAKKYGDSLNKPIHGISDNALWALKRYAWPGNVRELEHLIERAVVLCRGSTITTRDLPVELVAYLNTDKDVGDEGYGTVLYTPLTPGPEERGGASANTPPGREAAVILETLAKCGGNKAKAARLLGIDRSTLYRKIKELDIDLSIIALE
jgi:DNA-binding NtrC family response regulator